MILPAQSHKSTLLVLALASTLSARSACSQNSDLTALVHEKVDYYANTVLIGAKAQTDKDALAVHPPDQLVRALISELDSDRGSLQNNKGRDVAVYKLFHALNLPPALLLAELSKPQMPERKASLLTVLRECKAPEVVPALLLQLTDRREVAQPAVMPMEHARPFPSGCVTSLSTR